MSLSSPVANAMNPQIGPFPIALIIHMGLREGSDACLLGEVFPYVVLDSRLITVFPRVAREREKWKREIENTPVQSTFGCMPSFNQDRIS